MQSSGDECSSSDSDVPISKAAVKLAKDAAWRSQMKTQAAEKRLVAATAEANQASLKKETLRLPNMIKPVLRSTACCAFVTFVVNIL